MESSFVFMGGLGDGIEENILALLDSSSAFKDPCDLHDDRATFLEAVRSSFLSSNSLPSLSWRVFDAVFQIMRDSGSLDLTMGSYKLLRDLSERYPRIYSSTSDGKVDLIIIKEAWSPFVLGADAAFSEREDRAAKAIHLFDSLKFSELVQDISQAVNSTNFKLEMKPLENMVMLQYLVGVLHEDFICRRMSYKESSNWMLFRESLINMLLGSRKLIFKIFVRDCMSLTLKKCSDQVGVHSESTGTQEEYSDLLAYTSNAALSVVLPELEKMTLNAVKTIFTMVMELDLIRKEADSLGFTSRIDGCRTPIMEIILDELTYNIYLISPFLMAFPDSNLKLQIILQYFSKYCRKTAVRTRRTSGSSEDITLKITLGYFSTTTGAKGIAKKITTEVAQLLLAHAYQACLSLQDALGDVSRRIGGPLMEISNDFINAFRNLKQVYRDIEITAFEKEALFVAATIAHATARKTEG